MKDYRGQRQRFQNKFNDIKFNNGNEPEIDMFSEAQAFMSWTFLIQGKVSDRYGNVSGPREAVQNRAVRYWAHGSLQKYFTDLDIHCLPSYKDIQCFQHILC